MKRCKYMIAGVTALACLASPVVAQNSDWNYTASIYLFMPETRTSVGGLEAELSFKTALENLDVAFMGAFEASNGRLSFLADYMLNDVSFQSSTPGSTFANLNSALKTQILSGYAAYRVYDDPNVRLDLAAGFRWFKTNTTLTLTPGVLPGRTTTADQSWTDPIVGARLNFQISDKWTGTVFGDYGGFSSDSETWQILLTANYKINENWVARLGYRQISFDHDLDGTDFTYDQSGPIFGASYRF